MPAWSAFITAVKLITALSVTAPPTQSPAIPAVVAEGNTQPFNPKSRL